MSEKHIEVKHHLAVRTADILGTWEQFHDSWTAARKFIVARESKVYAYHATAREATGKLLDKAIAIPEEEPA